MKLTDRQISNLKPRATRYEVWEKNSFGKSNGFGIRIFPTGAKSWCYMYRYNGKQRRMKLGEYPKMSLAEAHSIHAKAVLDLENGIDPGEEKKLIKLSNLEALTVSELIEEYIEKWAKPRKRSWREDERILKGEVKKTWGNAKARQIKRRDIVVFLDSIHERAPIMANRTLAVIRRMFNFAIERDILETSPCTQVKMPSTENRRERLLSEEEIKIFWYALDKSEMHYSTIFSLKMMLATGQRKGEVISMRWDEIDLKNNIWEIPAEKSKNKKSHRVYMNKFAKEILDGAKKNLGSNTWVFPSSTSQDTHISAMAINKAIYREFNAINVEQQKKIPLFSGIAKFTPHDLRRTVASHMTAVGISRFIVSKILNHVESSVTAIYDRHTYDQEKREALNAWASKLTELLGHS